MATINDNLKLKAGYLFPEIARRVNAFAEANLDTKVRLGGDVTEPLPGCRTAMIRAVEEWVIAARSKAMVQSRAAWLREKIAIHDFKREGVKLSLVKSSSRRL